MSRSQMLPPLGLFTLDKSPLLGQSATYQSSQYKEQSQVFEYSQDATDDPERTDEEDWKTMGALALRSRSGVGGKRKRIAKLL